MSQQDEGSDRLGRLAARVHRATGGEFQLPGSVISLIDTAAGEAEVMHVFAELQHTGRMRFSGWVLVFTADVVANVTLADHPLAQVVRQSDEPSFTVEVWPRRALDAITLHVADRPRTLDDEEVSLLPRGTRVDLAYATGQSLAITDGTGALAAVYPSLVADLRA